MIKVNWFSTHPNGATELSTEQLDRVTNDIIENSPDFEHYQCPAFIDSLKDTYIIRSPIDIKIRCNYSKDQFFWQGLQEHISVRTQLPNPQTKYVSFSIAHYNYFVSDDEGLEIEQLPAFYHKNDFTDKTQLVIGKFNIGQWYRPLEVASCIIPDQNEVDITINKGDPLSYIRFNKPVQLNRITDNEEITKIHSLANSCVALKKTNPKLSLKSMYELFKPFRKKKKECPFNLRKFF